MRRGGLEGILVCLLFGVVVGILRVGVWRTICQHTRRDSRDSKGVAGGYMNSIFTCGVVSTVRFIVRRDTKQSLRSDFVLIRPLPRFLEVVPRYPPSPQKLGKPSSQKYGTSDHKRCPSSVILLIDLYSGNTQHGIHFR